QATKVQPSGSRRRSAALIPSLLKFSKLLLWVSREAVVEGIEVPSNRVDLGWKSLTQQLVGTKNFGQLFSKSVKLMRTTKSPTLKVVNYVRYIFQNAEDVATRK